MKSEDMVEGPLMSVQFYKKSKIFFYSELQFIYCFRFYCKRRLNMYF